LVGEASDLVLKRRLQHIADVAVALG